MEIKKLINFEFNLWSEISECSKSFERFKVNLNKGIEDLGFLNLLLPEDDNYTISINEKKKFRKKLNSEGYFSCSTIKINEDEAKNTSDYYFYENSLNESKLAANMSVDSEIDTLKLAKVTRIGFGLDDDFEKSFGERLQGISGKLDCQFFFFKINNKVIGATSYFRKKGSEAPYCRMNTCVFSEFRGQGLGGPFLNETCSIINGPVFSRTENESMKRLNLKMNYSKVGSITFAKL